MEYERLARRVIEQALLDACGSGGRAVLARGWLLSGSARLRFWCDASGVSMTALPGLVARRQELALALRQRAAAHQTDAPDDADDDDDEPERSGDACLNCPHWKCRS